MQEKIIARVANLKNLVKMIENYCGFESSLARSFCAELKEAKKKPAESSFERLSLRGRVPFERVSLAYLTFLGATQSGHDF
jgi:hypothetical protein